MWSSRSDKDYTPRRAAVAEDVVQLDALPHVRNQPIPLGPFEAREPPPQHCLDLGGRQDVQEGRLVAVAVRAGAPAALAIKLPHDLVPK
jgi:hypothetical protein